MAKVKVKQFKKPRGENWDTIHENLRMLARRIVTAEGNLDDIQAVYAAMRVAKHYDELSSSEFIAKKLTHNSAAKGEE